MRGAQASVMRRSPGRPTSGSKRVQHAIAVSFGGLQSVAEVQELILRGTALHLVDGPAHVSNQMLQFVTVHRDDFDVTT